MMQAIQALQAQMAQSQAENQQLRDRIQNYEQQMAQTAQAAQAAQSAAAAAAASSPTANGGGGVPATVTAMDVLEALQGLPDALAKMSKPKGLIDARGLGKPVTLGDDAETKFRLWALKLEDYVAGVFTGKCREVLEWAAGLDSEVSQIEIDRNFGRSADLLDQWDEVDDFNQQLYTVLRATTEG